MFYCYVLKSERTGRRYVGSCEDLEVRFGRHNLGKVQGTKHGTPWIMLHREVFDTRRQAITKELYYKTGRGRDELDRITRGRSPRRLTPIFHL